jgi:hypothetical protein
MVICLDRDAFTLVVNFDFMLYFICFETSLV